MRAPIISIAELAAQGAAYDRRQREMLAHLEAEHERQLADERAGRGWGWNPAWGQQPADQHVRDWLNYLARELSPA